MPPKKRARVSQATSPAATDQHKTPTPAAQSPGKTEEDILNDPWTDEEAIGLFKAIIKWKPTGIHKHFRMLQIRQYLIDNRYINPKAPHTSSRGIWQKLNTLYDLEALDQREDARQLSDLSDSASNSDSESDEDEDDVYSLADNKIHKQPFSLPEDEYIEDLAWKRRFPSEKARRERSESPLVLPEVNMDREAPMGFVKSLREEGASELPISSPEPEDEKRPRGRPKGTTSAKAGAQAPAAERRRSTRQVVEPSDEEDEGEGSEDDENEEDDEDEEEEEEDSSEEEEEGSEETTPAPRSNRRGRGRGRPARGGGSGNPRGRPRKK